MTTNGGGRQAQIYLLALAAVTCGVIAIVAFLMSQQSAPQPDPSAAGTIPSSSASPRPGGEPPSRSAATGKPASGSTGGSARPRPGQFPLAASVPTSIDIPAIGVRSAVLPIGTTPGGALAVPKGPNIDKAAWYENSVTPGQTGPSVIEGHVDTVDGPSVFFNLGDLRPDDTIKVTRADDKVAIFTVDAVRAYESKAEFPTTAVYGGDLSTPTLRLITCSNFDDSIGHYLGNTVVFAHLTDVRRLVRSS
jgi:sortase (surface protein transpeptidase)